VPKHVAFLRGINVGGHRVGRDDLRSCFEELGYGDVATFRASGNVIFDTGREAPARMATRIETALAKALGYEVPVFVRTAAELRAIADHQPFAAKLVAASAGKLQVAFFSTKPTTRGWKALEALATDEDKLALEGRELYWLPSGGILDSALDMNAIEKALGPMTMRTKNTVDQIAAKYLSG
jgi:uncharacterized protein (DUF1697 family)